MTTTRMSAIGATLLALAVAGLGLAAPPEPRAEPLGAAGVASCVACHNSTVADAASHPFATRYDSHEFILLSEGRTWPREDPHSAAYRGMTNELGRKMLSRLPQGHDAVWVAAHCATCHAVDTLAGDDATPPVHDHVTRFDTKDGVSCTACHGTAKAWQTQHYEERTDAAGVKSLPWRKLDPAAKAKAGLRDLRDPAVKARLCATCHVGSDELGRVVTHDLYAAGHPPLPPFELATYLEGEPRHWAPTAKLPHFDKLAEDPGKLWRRYHSHPAGDEVPAGRELAAGAVAALRAEATMLQTGTDSTRDGLDFARFDCSACHHDLKTPSDRQARGPKHGAPGRPTLRPSIAALAGVVAAHAAASPDATLKASAAEFATKWDALSAAAVERPFGNADAVRIAAADLVRWCDAFLDVQSRHPAALYSEAQVAALRQRLGDAALGEANRDPEAALVLTWGYVALSDGLPADRLAALAKVLPTTVRPRPAGAAREPAALDWQSRQSRLNGYRVEDFVTPFRALTSR